MPTNLRVRGGSWGLGLGDGVRAVVVVVGGGGDGCDISAVLMYFILKGQASFLDNVRGLDFGVGCGGGLGP